MMFQQKSLKLQAKFLFPGREYYIPRLGTFFSQGGNNLRNLLFFRSLIRTFVAKFKEDEKEAQTDGRTHDYHDDDGSTGTSDDDRALWTAA